jgi:hypothetical protein
VRRTRTILAGAALAGALVVAGSASASPGRSSNPPPDVAAELQREVDAMRAGGLPADHPKVAMLQRELEALVAGTDAAPVPDPGADAPGARGQAATPEQAVQLERQTDAAAGEEAESGTVECEPIPGALTAAEAGAATCLSVPEPDGTSRYLAVEPSGMAHVVRFGAGGRVERLPDEQLEPGEIDALAAG